LKVGDYAKIKQLIAEANKVGDVQDLGLEYFTSMADGSFFRGQDHKDTRIQTCLDELDNYMGGGLDYGELGIILGSSKRGKSMFLVNLGKAAVYWGKKVVHYTFELSLKKTAKRYDSTFSGIEYKKLDDDPVEIRDRVMNIMNEMVVNEALVIKSYPTRSCSVDMIASHLDRLQAKGFYPDMLVVDYADIMKANRRINDSLREEASIYEDLRGLSMSRNLAVWTASQAGRQAFGKDLVEMEDTGGTISKIQIADYIITLCQNKEEKALVPPVIRLFVAGARDVKDGSHIRVQTDFERISIGSVPKNE
jgi:replicative DNA helicase